MTTLLPGYFPDDTCLWLIVIRRLFGHVDGYYAVVNDIHRTIGSKLYIKRTFNALPFGTLHGSCTGSHIGNKRCDGSRIGINLNNIYQKTTMLSLGRTDALQRYSAFSKGILIPGYKIGDKVRS